MNRILCAAFAALTAASALAQSGTNSPYSQYGIGTLSDQATGANIGMSGLGYGWVSGNEVNYLNPASYAATDSLSFIFDAAASGIFTNYAEGAKKVNAKNGNFEYVVASFRAARHLGVSFGVMPISNVGYNYSNTQYVFDDKTVSTTTYTNTYNGEGGLHQAYVGAGWAPFASSKIMPLRGLAVGANVSYVWGDFTRSVTNSYSETSISTLGKTATASVSSYGIGLGLQYSYPIDKKNTLTAGIVWGMGHKLGADAEMQIISTNSQSGVSDTTTTTAHNAIETPMKLGAGVVWAHGTQWKAGIDYTMQKWGSCVAPVYSVVNDVQHYEAQTGQYKDRHKITLGGEYCHKAASRRFIDRMRFRAGVSYATPYLKINGQDGPTEMTASLGIGLPIINNYGNRSIVNVAAQWVHLSADNMIKENSFRITVGLTFNERWFAKWKVE